MRPKLCEVIGCGQPIGDGLLSFCEPHWKDWHASPEATSAAKVSCGLAELGDGPAFDRMRDDARAIAKAVFSARMKVPAPDTKDEATR